MDNQDGSVNDYQKRKAERDAKRNRQAGQAARPTGKRILTWVLSLALLTGIVWLVWDAAKNVPASTDGGTLAVAVSDADLSQGATNAPAVLVEYSDFQCPACAAYHPVLKQVLADPALAGKVRFVYRHFPLTNIHRNAQQAAQAAQAAAAQGKFWEMHDKLFAGQTKWSGMSGTGARSQFKTYAEELNLDVARWERDLDSDAVKDKVADDLEGGIASKVDSTPTFFLNGVKMPPPASVDQFRQAIIDATVPRASP